jgi:hypothetical protein
MNCKFEDRDGGKGLYFMKHGGTAEGLHKAI